MIALGSGKDPNDNSIHLYESSIQKPEDMESTFQYMKYNLETLWTSSMWHSTSVKTTPSTTEPTPNQQMRNDIYDHKVFHPKNVFKAVPFSQMISTLERNSEETWKEKEMKKMIEDFKKSGYDENELLLIK